MVFNVSPQLWDNLLAVLSSLTQWKEVVITWKVSAACEELGCGLSHVSWLCYC